jgi:hypothetical protein
VVPVEKGKKHMSKSTLRKGKLIGIRTQRLKEITLYGGIFDIIKAKGMVYLLFSKLLYSWKGQTINLSPQNSHVS